MKITVNKDVDIEELMQEWVDIFSSEEREWEFNAHDWDIITNTMLVLQKYYEKYGDIND